MSAQNCMVCDQCKKHVERPSDLHDLRPGGLERQLPLEWWTFRPRVEGINWLTFCGPVCVTNYLLRGEAR